MKTIIIAIGDELTLGQSIDTNSAWLSHQLRAVGIVCLMHQTVPDDRAAIVRALRQAADQAEVVLLTGGLGPTEDDLTRPAMAEVTGSSLEMNPVSLEEIRSFFTRIGREMPPANEVQAMLPAGAEPISNSCGTAPGIKAVVGRTTVYAMPGVPREMKAMFIDHVLPQLAAHGTHQATILTTELHSFGMGESTVGEKLNDLMARDRNPTVGTTACDGIVTVRIRCHMPDPAAAKQAINETASEVRRRLGEVIFGRDGTTLGQAVVELLSNQQLTVATAESCTGGMIASLITDVPGSSRVFTGGWVTYANRTKTDQLGVPARIIYSHGAVSEPVVSEMARCSLDKSAADLAVATSGIAGPEGGSAEKPVGTVWLAMAYRDKTDNSVRIRTMHTRLPGDRGAVRLRASYIALQMLRLHMLKQPVDLIQFADQIN